ncbi:MAG: hypothetical protein GY812_04070 [Actinomycetia bacterium]|nr:hypothetical protein [Actinomycetes bacterium]
MFTTDTGIFDRPESQEVIVDLPPAGEFTDVGILGFANPEMASPDEGPAWRDEMVVTLD